MQQRSLFLSLSLSFSLFFSLSFSLSLSRSLSLYHSHSCSLLLSLSLSITLAPYHSRSLSHSDSEPLYIGMLVMGHSLIRSLIRSLVCSHRSIVCLLRSRAPLRSLTCSRARRTDEYFCLIFKLSWVIVPPCFPEGPRFSGNAKWQFWRGKNERNSVDAYLFLSLSLVKWVLSLWQWLQKEAVSLRVWFSPNSYGYSPA